MFRSSSGITNKDEGSQPTINIQPLPVEERTPSRLLYRRHEDEHTYFRCGRYFTVGHEWYATIREGTDLGPFLHRTEAEIALVKYVADQHISTKGGIAEIFARSEDEATAFEKLVREVVECWEQRHLRSDNSAYVWIMQRLEAMNEEHGHCKIESRVLERLLTDMG